jgi:hypothetical protein
VDNSVSPAFSHLQACFTALQSTWTTYFQTGDRCAYEDLSKAQRAFSAALAEFNGEVAARTDQLSRRIAALDQKSRQQR